MSLLFYLFHFTFSRFCNSLNKFLTSFTTNSKSENSSCLCIFSYTVDTFLSIGNFSIYRSDQRSKGMIDSPVNKKICLGIPSFGFSLKMAINGSLMFVPPIFAVNELTCFMAVSKFFSLYSTLPSGKSLVNYTNENLMSTTHLP